MTRPFASRSHRLLASSAALALALTACSGGAPDSTETKPETSSSSVTNGGDVLEVTGTAALKWEPPSLSAAAGEVTVELTSLGATHNFIIEGVNDDQPIVEALAGETQSAAIKLAASEDPYIFYCNITGHREAGMEGELTVS